MRWHHQFDNSTWLQPSRLFLHIPTSHLHSHWVLVGNKVRSAIITFSLLCQRFDCIKSVADVVVCRQAIQRLGLTSFVRHFCDSRGGSTCSTPVRLGDQYGCCSLCFQSAMKWTDGRVDFDEGPTLLMCFPNPYHSYNRWKTGAPSSRCFVSTRIISCIDRDQRREHLDLGLKDHNSMRIDFITFSVIGG